MRIKHALFAVVPLVISVSAVAQNSAVKGIVVDPTGAPISRAFVLFHTDALKPENPVPYDLTLRTDKQGKFSADLPPGFYALFIGAGDFEPNCQAIRIRIGVPQDLTIQLKLDPEYVKEYGDEFTAPEPFKPLKVPPELQRPPH